MAGKATGLDATLRSMLAVTWKLAQTLVQEACRESEVTGTRSRPLATRSGLLGAECARIVRTFGLIAPTLGLIVPKRR
jgi:hypothetical protein